MNISEAMKKFEVNEAKTVEIPNTNIELKKIAMDTNGNKTVYFTRGAKNGKIQTNGNMPKTHSMGLFKTPKALSKLTDSQLEVIGTEIQAYYKDIGESMVVIKKQQSKFDGLSNFEGRFINLVNGVFGTVKFDSDKKEGLIPTRNLGDIPFSFNGQSDGVYIEFSKGKKALSKNDTALGKVIGKIMEIDKLGDWE